jgi:4-hydroxy-tetrahydrodipicolinate synthase
MADDLKGVFPVVYSPFDAEGNIDEEDLRKLVEHLISVGVHGVSAVGTASESQKLTNSEREWMARVVIDQVKGRVPVLVGTSAENTGTAVELSEAAEKAGAAAVFLSPPSWGPLTPKAIKHHYAKVAAAVKIPVIVQHFTIPVPAKLMVELTQEHDNVRYIKEEAPDNSSHMITEVMELSGGKAKVFTAGVYFPDELARGVIGAIPACVGAASLVQCYNLFTQGDPEAARKAYNHVLPLLYARPNPYIWAKEVLRRQGIFKAAHLREPAGMPLDEHDRHEIAAIMEHIGPPY